MKYTFTNGGPVKMPDRPMVSFAIPVYRPDRAMFSDMLQSVVDVARTYGNSEILLHNDGNEPRTAEILEKARAFAPDLVKVSGAYPNSGIPASRQFLLEQSNGSYYVHFDQDDIMMPFDLASTVAFLEDNKEYVLDYGSNIIVEPDDIYFESVEYSRFSTPWHFTLRPNACVLKTGALRRAGGYANCPRGIPDDVWMFQRVCCLGRVRHGVRRTAWLKHDNNAGKSSTYGILEQLANARKFLAAHRHEEEHVRRLMVPEGVSPWLFPIIAGATYFTSRSKEEGKRIISFAVKQFPDDWGARLVWLLCNAGSCNASEMRGELDTVRRMSRGNPEFLFCYSSALLLRAELVKEKSILRQCEEMRESARTDLQVTEAEKETISRLRNRPPVV